MGLDRSDLIIAHAQTLGFVLRREHFGLRSDDQPHMWELIKAGLGVGFAQARLVRDTPGMVALPLKLSIPALSVWLTTHRELFTSHRIRAIYDALAEGIAGYINDYTASVGHHANRAQYRHLSRPDLRRRHPGPGLVEHGQG
ncbi:MAG: LysR substrate-binding domain-containing protein, partial [Candidatus Devosia euplotis]|nr:LysR substrate-binding domain-containing protein [Candidatus Devosia euplotis]